MCECKRCGQPAEDCLTLCIKCFLETSDDRVKKNIVAGGRFYERRTMREKIVDIIREGVGCDYDHNLTNEADAADQILTLITEEIEKVENPYMPNNEPFNLYCNDKNGFEDCRNKILALFRPKGNPVGNAEL